MNDAFEMGPFRITDFDLQRLNIDAARFDVSASLKDLLRITVRSANLQVKAVAESRVEVPKLGLEGNGHYTFELKDLTIRKNVISTRARGWLDLHAGPLHLDAQIEAVGSGPMDPQVDLRRLEEHLKRTAQRAQVDFSVRAKLKLGPITLGRLTGRGDMTTKSFSSQGDFALGLPPLLYARGAYQFDHLQGLSARGWSAGLLTPLNGLGVEQSGPISFLKPGLLQFGVSLFDLNLPSGKQTIFTLGVSPTSNFRSPDGNTTLPFAGKSEGIYSGASLKLKFF